MKKEVKINKEKLKNYRLAAGLTQVEIAKKIGISQGGYTKWETGFRNPSLNNIANLCTTLNIVPDDICLDSVPFFNNIKQTQNHNAIGVNNGHVKIIEKTDPTYADLICNKAKDLSEKDKLKVLNLIEELKEQGK